MINTLSLKAFEKNRWTPHFNRPLYDSYSFSLISQTVEKLLTGNGAVHLPVDTVGGHWKQYDTVVLFLIDGFGWEFFNAFAHQYPFLERFSHSGTASKISSQFPSTTAAHVTTMNTGMEVGQTGIYEWFQYDPLVDAMIAPLCYSFAGDRVLGSLKKSGIRPNELFPFETIYEKFAKMGIRSIAMQDEDIASSPYSQTMLKGSENLSYKTFAEALANVVKICKEPKKQPTFLFVYMGEVDSAGHRHGITSPEFADAVEHCWTLMENQLFPELSSFQNTAVMVTADHGMAPVDPTSTLYLNRSFPEIEETFKKAASGKPLVPAGSCRDFFLRIQESRIDEVHEMLGEKFMGIADVVRVEKLIQEGFFGRFSPSSRFLERVGNLVVLPYLGESIWWWEKHRFEQHFFAAHGGLTPSEIESILLFLDPSDL